MFWIFKCNSLQHSYQLAYGDWNDFFGRATERRWGTTEYVPALSKARRGDTILAYQTDRNELVGLAKVTALRPRGRYLDLILRPMKRIGVKIRPLKESDRRIAGIPALQPGPIRTLYDISRTDAKRLLRAAGAHFKTGRTRTKGRLREIPGGAGPRDPKLGITSPTIRTKLFESCIFTISHTSALEEISGGDRRGELIEGKPWIKGNKLLDEARRSGKRLPLIFAAADHGGGLIYWAAIDDITLHTGKRPRTSVSFSALQPLAKQWPKHSLKKLSNDKPLSDHHIHGYVPCHTPRFLFAAFPATAKPVPATMKGSPKHGASDYACAFRKIAISPHHKRMLQAHYYSDQRTLTATGMAHAMHYENWNGANLQYGKLAKLVGKALGWRPLPYIALSVLATFEKPEHEWLWIMRAEIAESLEQLGWVGEDAYAIPQEIAAATPVFEGAVREIKVNAYERSTVARQKCILHHGPTCSACGVVLADLYGEVAQGHVHVHHLRPLAALNGKYRVDPARDLRPVCPNYHAVIHLKTPPYTIQQVRRFLQAQSKSDMRTMRLQRRPASHFGSRG